VPVTERGWVLGSAAIEPAIEDAPADRYRHRLRTRDSDLEPSRFHRLVLPVLFGVPGQTGLAAAGKLLQIEPHRQATAATRKGYATPLRAWPASPRPISPEHARHRPRHPLHLPCNDTRRQKSRQAVKPDSKGRGYQPEP
jgi:hypothetical protein